jgi:phage tail tape-measure protein
MKTKEEELKDARNEDPITGEPGSHPVGVGVGTAAGAAAGGAIGAIGGPVGAAVGAIVGGVAGAAAGKAGGEAVNPTVEDEYWREAHARQEYADAADNYEDDYAPAYQLGWEGPNRYGTDFNTAENSLRTDWEERKGKSKLDWQVAKNAVRSGWHRIERKLPGDADKDGI